MATDHPFEILAQPDDTSCGPTCLHAVYRHFGEQLPLEQLLDEVRMLEAGGTLAVFLGCHALRRGYRATIITYNLHVFDPSWFGSGGTDLAERLEAQARVKPDPKLQFATAGYLEFLRLGGVIRFEDLIGDVLRRYLRRGHPIITGLSATFLYRSPREIGNSQYDDIRGAPVGHFVVLCEYPVGTGQVLIADPLHPNPVSETGLYAVGINRVINAILLGVLTYDANLLVIRPATAPARRA